MNTHVSMTASGSSAALAIRMLTLTSIEPSATTVQERRRSRYDEGALKELAENIKAVQVIEPIIVRPKIGSNEAESFEIVAGERRWRASRQAGLESIPAIVRSLDNGQVLEIQLVENLHSEGLIGYVANLSSISRDCYTSSLRECRCFRTALNTANA
jgi:ParB family chromosome partitioning protein